MYPTINSKLQQRRGNIAARIVLALSLSLPGVSILAEIRTGIDAEARLPYWEVVTPRVSIRLVQRLPDQTRGFFQARGFPVEDSELIAQSCVFQTVFKNRSTPSAPVTISYNLREWAVHTGDKRRGLKTREDWQKIWRARQSPKPAQIAFEWALLPTRQTYRPGDYNWGMTLFGLKTDRVFDLDVVWYENGSRRHERLTAVRCAPDIQVAPGEL